MLKIVFVFIFICIRTQDFVKLEKENRKINEGANDRRTQKVLLILVVFNNIQFGNNLLPVKKLESKYSFSISDKISITDIERKAYWKIWKNLQFVISTSQLFFPQYLCIHLHVHAIKLIVTVLPIYIMKYSLTIKNCPNPVPKVHFSLV